MKFSVLIPTLNEEKYIPKLLDSLLEQTHKDFEVILVDGNSVDKTVELANGYKSKLNLRIVLSKKKGVSRQRNLAAKNARSSNLVFFDADVQPEKLFLEKLSSQIRKGGFRAATAWNIPISKKKADHVIFGAFNILYLEGLKKIFPGAVGTFIYAHKNVFNQVKGFDENIFIAEDFDLARRIHEAGYRFEILREPKIYFSTRRLDKEGRLNFLRKIFKAGLHYHIFGAGRTLYNREMFEKKFGGHNFGEHV